MNRYSENILLVDDDDSLRDVLEIYLESEGFTVVSASSAALALELFGEDRFSAVLADIQMPECDGLSLLSRLKGISAEIPVILMTGSPNLSIAIQAVRLGAYDFLLKPFQDMNLVSLALRRAMEHASLVRENRNYQADLETKVKERTEQLNQALNQVASVLEQNKRAHLETIVILSKVAELNDADTGNHIKRMSLYCEEITRGLQLDDLFIEEIAYSSPMHDIGKISIPNTILQKPGKLTEDEFEVMKTHTVKGEKILDGIPFLERAKEIALSHHERFDGLGYPHGLRGEEIPLSARIVSLADVFDALTSKRCYKPAFPLEQALNIIKEEKGKQFDPDILAAFFDRQESIFEILRRLQ
ncbi:MAG: response regulator [Planctomycetota bacterium]|jgi:putative two-component system response regulator|nr:response regulator [Planctomycetota bacterium]